MGCFSFLCKESGKAVASSSFDGDACRMFLLKDGKVIEEMRGHYDSYGRVFSDVKDQNDTSLTDTSSFEWKMEWREVCNLMFSPNKSNGIAVVLEKYWKGNVPTTRSESDPNQGWGKKNGGKIIITQPYHIVHNEIEHKSKLKSIIGKLSLQTINETVLLDRVVRELVGREAFTDADPNNVERIYHGDVFEQILSEQEHLVDSPIRIKDEDVINQIKELSMFISADYLLVTNN